MAQYGFAFIGKYCSGCKTCMLACKDCYDLTEEIDFRRVYEYGGGKTTVQDDGTVVSDVFGYYVSIACNHCANPACTEVCPTGAMHKDQDTGLVGVDTDRCIGCGYCAMSCPYASPTVDREKGHSVKCSGCIERVKQGLSPICVEACPQRALVFGELSALRNEYGSLAEIAPLPPSEQTNPSIAIVPPSHALKPYDNGGCILNSKEVM